MFCKSVGGRPRIQIHIDDVEFLRGLNFTWTKIAEILGCSRSTLYRRLEEEGISRDCYYANITDGQLDATISQIKESHPKDGEVMILGHLRRRGIRIQRWRVRASIHRIDPINTALRRRRTVRRRVYHVSGPNAVWHLDGNHKLIHWRMVIHGAIDGYSRLITFLNCSSSNTAATVLAHFQNAVEIHGLPQKVRTDLGGENTEVWRYMVHQHQTTECVLVGSSVHNERIERLWRDVFRCVLSVFYETFKEMENDGTLDCLNEVDMFCLHVTFLPRINAVLREFVESWNNHAISTERNLTPNQFYVQGFLQQGSTPDMPHHSATQNVTIPYVPQAFVSVPRSTFSPCTQLQMQLSTINPVAHCHDFGVTVYLQVVQLVGQHIESGCISCSS